MYLQIERGPNAGKTYNIKSSIRVGRSSDCDIVLNDSAVSRHHAEFRASGNGVVVTDTQSRNGVRVNDQRVRGSQSLRAGDRIKIGSAVFVVRADSGGRETALTRGERTVAPSYTMHGQIHSSLACPRCGQTDTVNKVSAIVLGGVARHEGVYRQGNIGIGGFFGDAQGGIIGGGVTGGRMQGYSISALAEVLSPPQQASGCLVELFAPDKAKRAQQDYQRAFQRWQKLYYCARDDGVFIPGETGLIPTSDLKAFLYH